MKRSDSGERGEEPAKRQRDDQRGANREEHWSKRMRLMIPSRVAGSIIGRGGETIRRLRADYEATVAVPDSSAPERIVNLGGELSNLISLLKDILPKLGEGGREDRHSDDKLEVRLLVHQSHAGAVIGRAGNTIKDLRRDTGAQIKVFSETCPYSTERVALITGNINEVTKCIEKIYQLCEDIPIKGGVQEYVTESYDPAYTPQYGGVPPDGRLYGAAREDEWEEPSSRFARPGPAAYGDRYYDRRDHGRDYERYDRDRYPPRRHSPAPITSAVQVPRQRERQHDFTSDRTPERHREPEPKKSSLPPEMLVPALPHLLAQQQKKSVNPFPTGAYKQAQVTIPNELGGTIIGRGGERINLIRAESGAHIEVAAPGAGPIPNDRIITISGSDEQIQMAQYLLQRAVRESPAGRKYLEQGVYG